VSEAPDESVFERGKYGILPRIGANGQRPADVFAARAPPMPAGPATPRLAIVITGLGTSLTTTMLALDQLPAAITLAFSTQGDDLETHVGKARTAGHEILLELPMEGLPGSGLDFAHPLVTGPGARQNMEHLSWLMSRFTRYAGLMNFLGARLLTDRDALTPVLREAGVRGLSWFDDGSVAGSLVGEIAPRFQLPFRRADVTLDAMGASGLEAALRQMEATAKSKGQAIGVASALPGTIDRIAIFTKTLAQKGIVLVPLSAITPITPLAASGR
jgi:polysaccharide deacetylase 2 family uncharacterized protein YibQ